MKLTVTHKGGFGHLQDFLKNSSKQERIMAVLHTYGARGVDLLSAYTPYRTGLTARSWYYKIEPTTFGYDLVFLNSNVANGAGVNIALILQTGHKTGTRGYVSPLDYINPALGPLFDSLVQDLVREVNKV